MLGGSAPAGSPTVTSTGANLFRRGAVGTDAVSALPRMAGPSDRLFDNLAKTSGAVDFALALTFAFAFAFTLPPSVVGLRAELSGTGLPWLGPGLPFARTHRGWLGWLGAAVATALEGLFPLVVAQPGAVTRCRCAPARALRDGPLRSFQQGRFVQPHSGQIGPNEGV